MPVKKYVAPPQKKKITLTAAIHVRMPAEMKDAVDRAAHRTGRTATGIASLAIQDWLEKNGFV